MSKPSNIGGQAVMEGIMMRHGNEYSIAVRKPDGEIAVKKEPYHSVIPVKGIEKIPFARGLSSFVDSLVIGTRCIMYSASFFEEDEEADGKAGAAKTEEQKAKDDRWFTFFTVLFSVLLTVGLFILLPYFLAGLLRRAGAGELLVSAAEAVLRLVIFLVYMILISRLKDIQRVFMYHGAEHKCINCVENGKELTVENVLGSSRFHKRCGTSFLLIVVVLSVIFFLILGMLGLRSPWLRLLLRILLIPVIAGCAYEFIRLAGRSENRCIQALSAPGLLLQRLVTREPDAKMAEVAIAAVEEVFDWKAYLAENFPERAS